jgi:plastocyanin
MGAILVITAVLGACNGTPAGPGRSGQGGGQDGAAAPSAIAVTVGDVFFQSDRNATSNPAVDTVAVGGTVTWTWVGTTLSHSVRSQSSPGFASSAVLSGSGTTYVVTFGTAGIFEYDCAVHGTQMTGRVVVR